MSVQNAFKYTFIWRSANDARSCPACRALDGREYTDQDLFQPTLIDSSFGAIWNLDADCSLMHGESGTCRCRLEGYAEFDVAKWKVAQDFHNLMVRSKLLTWRPTRV